MFEVKYNDTSVPNTDAPLLSLLLTLSKYLPKCLSDLRIYLSSSFERITASPQYLCTAILPSNLISLALKLEGLR